MPTDLRYFAYASNLDRARKPERSVAIRESLLASNPTAAKSVFWDRGAWKWGYEGVTRYGRLGHLIVEGSKQLASDKRSATTEEVCGPAGKNVGIKRCLTDAHRPRRQF